MSVTKYCPAAALLTLSAVGAPAVAQGEPVTPLQQLCIYYGQPSEVNDSNGDLSRAIAAFSPCDVIVLGDGLEHPEHRDHGFTAQLIAELGDTGSTVFGYVDLGVTTQNLDEPTLRDYVTKWQSIGAEGIFFDDAGYDYGVTRARQNAVVDHAHELGLAVFMNAWNIDDVLSERDEADRPAPTRLGPGDWYLAESWLVAAGAYQPLDAWSTKADRALHYSRTKGIRIAAVSTAGVRKAGARDDRHRKFNLGWWGAAMYGLAAWQWTDAAYGAANDVLRTYDLSTDQYGSKFVEAAVTRSSDFRVHTRATDAGKIFVKRAGVGSRGGFNK